MTFFTFSSDDSSRVFLNTSLKSIRNKSGKM